MTVLPFSKAGIDGFRGLRHLELDGLGRINILVGGNNSGKTSVLEALSIICQPYNPDEWLEVIRRRDFGRLDESRVQSLRWCFSQAAGLNDPEQLLEATCSFTCQGNFPLEKLRVDCAEFRREPSTDELRQINRRRSRGVETDHIEIIHGIDICHNPNWIESHQTDIFLDLSSLKDSPLKLTVLEALPPNFVSKYRKFPKIANETLTPYSYQVNQNQVRSRSQQIFQHDSADTLELLRDFDQDIEQIDLASFHGYRPAIYIKHRKLGIAPLSIFGDAMRRAVLLASTLLLLKNGGVLLIDEVEAGIHVGALGRVFEWLVKAARTLNVQVFVTTHSLEALDALVAVRPVLDEGDDVVAFHLRQTDEKTHGKRLYGDLLRRLRFERGLDVR